MNTEKACTPIPCPPFSEVTTHVITTSELDQLAGRAYHAYGDVTDWKNFMGNRMPRYEDLPEKIKRAWHAAVRRVMDDVESIQRTTDDME